MDIRTYSDDELSLMFMNDEPMYKFIIDAEEFYADVLPFINTLGLTFSTGQLEQLKIDWDNGEFNV